MNDITKNLFEDLIPKMAIIVYHSDTDIFYLERRNIGEDGNLEAGVPLTEECLTNIVKCLSSSEKDIVHGILPSGLLYADCRTGRNKYVWYRKEEKRMLYFNEQLGISNGEMYVPGLVYHVSGGTLAVYAYKGKLTERSKLFRAPFFNVSSSSVCLGSAKVEKPEEMTYEHVLAYWEQMFWQSEFTHLLGGNPVKGNLSIITKHCIETGCRFPKEELIQCKKLTLGGLFQ